MKLGQAQQIRTKHRPLVILKPIITTAAMLLIIGGLILEYGFERMLPGLIWVRLAQIVGGGLLFGVMLWPAGWRGMVQRKKLFLAQGVLMGGLLLGLGIGPAVTETVPAGQLRWYILHGYLLMLVLLRGGRLTLDMIAVGRSPTRSLLSGFAVLIVGGALLLSLPACHRGEDLSITDAVFTSTSAVCVTGLIVRDTGTEFTRWGQVVILALIQVGGLGIMIFGTLFALLIGSSLSLRESIALQDVMNEMAPGRIVNLVLFICVVTLVLEGVGFLGLYGMWHTDELSGGQVFKSLFHAVSAFCNAGFSLQADSLEAYRLDVRSYAVICPLIVLGGLGFPVLHNVTNWGWDRLKVFLTRDRRRRRELLLKLTRLMLHTKIVLITTGVLLAVGAILLAVLELTRPGGTRAFNGLLIGLDALFNSVTARTAGFNTVEMGSRSTAGKMVLILLMVIGGSPSSTAGGIKTVTFAVIVLTIVSTIRRRDSIFAFHRTILFVTIKRVATLIILYSMLLWVITTLLTITEHSVGANLLDLLFESASAMGTVGLSTGITSSLSTAGKWVIIMAMLVGRLGPLTLLAALSFNPQPTRYEYPAEPLVVG